MAELESLQFRVESLSETGSKGVDQLATSLRSLKSAVGSDSGGLASKLDSLANALGKISNSSRVTKVAKALGELGNIHISSTTPKNVQSLATALQSINGEQASNVKELASSFRELADQLDRIKGVGSLSSIKSVSNAVTTDAKDLGTTNITATEGEVSETKSSVDSMTASFGMLKAQATGVMFQFLKGLGLETVKASAQGATIALQGFGKALWSITGAKFASFVKSVTSSLGGLMRTIKRIALVKLIRSLMSLVTDAFRVGIQNLYNWSSAIGGTFANSMDTLSTSFQYLKNSMAAAASPLINALAPAIDYVIDKIVTLLNLINQLLARLSGASFYTAATKSAASYGAAAGSAAGAAEKLKKTILGFDEINKLDEPNSGSGGGGGGAGSGAGSMFEEIPIDSEISAFADKLREAIDAENWLGLGTLLGDKVNEIIDGIDWNGIGEYFGKKFNMVVETGLGFLRTFDGFKAGGDIGEMFVSFFETAHWDSLGSFMIRKVTTAVDMVLGFVTTKGLGSSIGSAISGFIGGALTDLTNWVSSRDWATISVEFGNNIGEMLAEVDWGGLAKKFWTFLGVAIGECNNIVSYIGAGIALGLSGMAKKSRFKDLFKDTASQIKQAIDEALGEQNGSGNSGKDGSTSKTTSSRNIPVTVSVKKSSMWDTDAFSAIKLKASTIARKVKQAVEKGKWDTNAWEGVKTKTAEIGRKVIQSVAKGTWDNTSWEGVHTKAATVARYLKQSVSKGSWDGTAWSGVGKAAETVSRYLKQNVNKNTWDGTAWSAVNTGAATVHRYIKQSVAKGSTWVSDAFTAAKAASGTIYKTLKISVSWIGSKLTEAWKVITGRASGGVLSVNGVWGNIPQYAGGTTKAGSLFVAGEAGPEVVGHLNGRTEVLNRSQMASTMFSAMVAGMQVFSKSMSTINDTLASCTNAIITNMDEVARGTAYALAAEIPTNSADTMTSNALMAYSDLVDGVREGVAEATARQNDLLRQQNELLMALLEKDTTAEFTTDSFTKAMTRKNQRDGRTVVAIG